MGNFGYMLDDEIEAGFDSLEEADGAAQQAIDDTYEPGEEIEYSLFETIRAVEIALGDDKSRMHLGEIIVETVDDVTDCLTHTDGETFTLSKNDVLELGNLVANFILDRAKLAVRTAKPGTQQKYTYVAGSDEEGE